MKRLIDVLIAVAMTAGVVAPGVYIASLNPPSFPDFIMAYMVLVLCEALFCAMVWGLSILHKTWSKQLTEWVEKRSEE